MTIERARKILGDLVVNLSDGEIEKIINLSKRFANVVLDYAERKISEQK